MPVSNSVLQCNLGNTWNKINLALILMELCDVSISEVYLPNSRSELTTRELLQDNSPEL